MTGPPVTSASFHLARAEQPDACVDGPPNGVPAVLFGDSHAQQWLPVVQAIAKENNWRLNQFTKAACPIAALQPGTAARPVHQIRLPRLARGQRQRDHRAETQVHRDQLAVHVRARLSRSSRPPGIKR